MGLCINLDFMSVRLFLLRQCVTDQTSLQFLLSLVEYATLFTFSHQHASLYVPMLRTGLYSELPRVYTAYLIFL